MPTLITGAGLVGTLAAERLVVDGLDQPVLYDVAFAEHDLKNGLNLENVSQVVGDVTDLPGLIGAIRDHGIDRIIHTAALHTSEVRKTPFSGARVNFLGTVAVLEAARVCGVKRIVICSSSTIYLGLRQWTASGSLGEDVSLRVVSEYPPSIYASLKLAAEWIAHGYRTGYGVDSVVIRLAGVFGSSEGVLSSPHRLIKMILESAWLGRPCELTTAEMTREGSDYVYARDAAQGVVRAVFARDPRSRVYNIAMGRLYSVQEIIDVVESTVGREVELRLVEGGKLSGYEGNPGMLDISRARAELGYEVEFPMEKAIEDYSNELRRSLKC
jgi:UDP-glucose 4-epimerase